MKTLIMINAIYTVVEIANFPGSANTTGFWGGATIGVGAIQANMTNQYIIMTTSTGSGGGGRSQGYAAAMSWSYFAVLIAVMLVVFVVYKLLTRGDEA
jgi:ABC-type sugar transport system permease subunit